jgi:hypothetical protein
MMIEPRRLFREVALRTMFSFLTTLTIGLIRFGSVVFEPRHWTFQLVVYGFVYGLFLAIWRVHRRNAFAFLIVYFFAESVFVTHVLTEARVFMVILYYGLTATALVWYERMFLRSTTRSILRESLGAAVMVGLAYICAAGLSLTMLKLLTDYDIEVTANLTGAATMGFLIGAGVGLGHSLADLPAVRRTLLSR